MSRVVTSKSSSKKPAARKAAISKSSTSKSSNQAPVKATKSGASAKLAKRPIGKLPPPTKSPAKGKAASAAAPERPIVAPKIVGAPKIHSKIQMRVESRWTDTPGERVSAGEDRSTPRPEVAPLKKKEIEMLKEVLVSEKLKLLRHLEEVSASSEEQLDSTVLSGDAADIASLEMAQASLQKIGKREGYLLKKIEVALNKINEGTYGLCESCGEPISLPRLQARPVAQLCIDCKTDQENEERRFSTRERSDDDDSEISEESEEG